ncbi:adenylyltransferase and sulfurtransferase MOCS3 [Diachasma alloeum]|uniref:adenylyltransferase and sulfurtransferase MOCS3 n=1 Tax=Diachasma alloeum TaxID=454923 RepID=UPI0007383970|nr:adenylyltransferase and sulfurtransferase MOCS3 [Diachasma alloeum]
MSEEELIGEIRELKWLLREKEDNLAELRREQVIIQKNGLNNEEIARYSRQILMPEISVKGQVKIKNASVLIVGAGGLGCPSALYLAGAGVGHIGIVDYDDVEINNLHRQLLYTSDDIGIAKVHAAADHLQRLNGNLKVTPYKLQLDSTNVQNIVEQYDVVLDATDNVPTRYLLNDACIFAGKPLVSGSALKFEGQLTVYNHQGPCYRCIFPKPPPPETVTNCGDGGVLGAAVGTIGVLQALEAIKIILDMPGVLSGRMLLFDGQQSTFRNIRLRSRDPNCLVCGEDPQITELLDYEQFCGSKANDKNPNLKLLKNDERITVKEYETVKNVHSHLLIDVRSREEFEICSLEGSVNIPYSEMQKNAGLERTKKIVDDKLQEDNSNVYIICRRGNDSQRAVDLLKTSLNHRSNRIKDIIGGIHAWTRELDSTFPIY